MEFLFLPLRPQWASFAARGQSTCGVLCQSCRVNLALWSNHPLQCIQEPFDKHSRSDMNKQWQKFILLLCVCLRCRLVHGHGGIAGDNILQRYCCLHTILHVRLVPISSAVVKVFQQHLHRSIVTQIKQMLEMCIVNVQLLPFTVQSNTSAGLVADWSNSSSDVVSAPAQSLSEQYWE